MPQTQLIANAEEAKEAQSYDIEDVGEIIDNGESDTALNVTVKNTVGAELGFEIVDAEDELSSAAIKRLEYHSEITKVAKDAALYVRVKKSATEKYNIDVDEGGIDEEYTTEDKNYTYYCVEFAESNFTITVSSSVNVIFDIDESDNVSRLDVAYDREFHDADDRLSDYSYEAIKGKECYIGIKAKAGKTIKKVTIEGVEQTDISTGGYDFVVKVKDGFSKKSTVKVETVDATTVEFKKAKDSASGGVDIKYIVDGKHEKDAKVGDKITGVATGEVTFKVTPKTPADYAIGEVKVGDTVVTPDKDGVYTANLLSILMKMEKIRVQKLVLKY